MENSFTQGMENRNTHQTENNFTHSLILKFQLLFKKITGGANG